jgi:hypothetical protein
MTQRTTQVLLLLLVLGVWGLLLRPTLTPEPVHAQSGASADRQLISTPNGLYLVTAGGRIFHFGADLTVKDTASPTVMGAQSPPAYTTVHGQ